MSAVTRSRRFQILNLWLGLSVLGSVSAAEGQALSPYSDFQAMSLAQLNSLQVKLSYFADYGNASATPVLFGAASQLDASLFVPYRRTDHAYVSDEGGHQKFTATVQELKALIDSVGTLPGVVDGDVDVNGYVSFALLNTSGGTKVFEAILDTANAHSLFGEILETLKASAVGTRMVRGLACYLSALPLTAPASIQGQVQLVTSGLRADRRSPSQYVGKVKLTNTSPSTIAGPIILVARIGGADLIGADGATCNILPPGAQFLTVLSSGGLAPGGSIERQIRIANPSGSKLSGALFNAYAGGGTP